MESYQQLAQLLIDLAGDVAAIRESVDRLQSPRALYRVWSLDIPAETALRVRVDTRPAYWTIIGERAGTPSDTWSVQQEHLAGRVPTGEGGVSPNAPVIGANFGVITLPATSNTLSVFAIGGPRRVQVIAHSGGVYIGSQ